MFTFCLLIQDGGNNARDEDSHLCHSHSKSANKRASTGLVTNQRRACLGWSFSATRSDYLPHSLRPGQTGVTKLKQNKITNNLRLLCGNENLVTIITITITIITITQVSPAWENNSVVMRSQDIRNFLCVPNLFAHCSLPAPVSCVWLRTESGDG